MTSAEKWQLDQGTAHVFPASKQGIERPVLLVAAPSQGPTDLAALEAGLSGDYPFIEQLNKDGRDLILVGFDNGNPPMSQSSNTIRSAIMQTVVKRLGSSQLVVGGIGEGALIALYSLTLLERQGIDHDTALYFSYDGTQASGQDADTLRKLGDRPMRPRLLKLVSDGFSDKLDDNVFDECTNGSKAETGQLISQDLGKWLLEKLPS